MATNLTADAVIAKIRAKVGATWMGGTSETIEYGDGSAPVTGIATVWTPSIEVLKRAAAAKHNFIVAVEPPFWVEAGTVKTESNNGTAQTRTAGFESGVPGKEKADGRQRLGRLALQRKLRRIAAKSATECAGKRTGI